MSLIQFGMLIVLEGWVGGWVVGVGGGGGGGCLVSFNT